MITCKARFRFECVWFDKGLGAIRIEGRVSHGFTTHNLPLLRGYYLAARATCSPYLYNETVYLIQLIEANECADAWFRSDEYKEGCKDDKAYRDACAPFDD